MKGVVKRDSREIAERAYTLLSERGELSAAPVCSYIGPADRRPPDYLLVVYDETLLDFRTHPVTGECGLVVREVDGDPADAVDMDTGVWGAEKPKKPKKPKHVNNPALNNK